MSAHYTAVIEVTKTTPEHMPTASRYDTPKVVPRETESLTKLVIRAESQSELSTKIAAALDAVLDYGVKD